MLARLTQSRQGRIAGKPGDLAVLGIDGEDLPLIAQLPQVGDHLLAGTPFRRSTHHRDAFRTEERLQLLPCISLFSHNLDPFLSYFT